MPNKSNTMKRTFFLLVALVFLTIQNHAQTLTDIDGNVNNTVTIGTQVWMADNLRVTHYRNGDPIPNIKDDSVWNSLCDPYTLTGTGARCYWNNDSVSYASVYGALYNYYTIDDSRMITPVGWHVPSMGDWAILRDYLGSDSAGGKLKEAGTSHWQSPNTDATNETGFTALPGDGFHGIGQKCSLWSTTVANSHWLWMWVPYMEYNSGLLILNTASGQCDGNYIRLVNDTLFTGLNEINKLNQIHLYPNPATDKIVIDFAERQNLSLNIYNIVGELMLQKELDKNKNEIDISTLSTGLYIIKVTGAEWTVWKKLIKE